MHVNDEYSINIYFNREERAQLIKDIKSVYPGGSRWEGVLKNMPDSQLLAFRNNLMKQGKINHHLYQIHISFLLKEAGANLFFVKSRDNSTTYYLGLEYKKATLQVGQVTVDEDNVITDCIIHGDKMKRFTGCLLKVGGL